jgi:teichuronic acid biosynthesis glycosyltransferase TuaC
MEWLLRIATCSVGANWVGLQGYERGSVRILTFTTLYPNEAKPQHGVFVENRLRQLVKSGEVSARVIAPVPYFPLHGKMFGRWSVFARAPLSEIRHGITIDHPRYLAIPKVGMTAAPFLLYAAARKSLAALLESGHRFDLIDAHYFYPDGVAAAMLGRVFGLPVTVTARGTDINVLPDYALPGRMIRWAANRVDGLITVSTALANRLASLGIDSSRIAVLRNGIDSEAFRPTAPFRWAGHVAPSPLALSVGNLVSLKGHDLAIRVLPDIRTLHLWIVGDGPERGRLEALAGGLGVAERVTFLGAVPHERMSEVYSAASILILASEREGWPNVLLEAMACGARVVATNVSDVSQIITEPAAGTWVPERTVQALVAAVRQLLAAPVAREATRAHALRFTWDTTTSGQIELFRRILHDQNMAGRERGQGLDQ